MSAFYQELTSDERRAWRADPSTRAALQLVRDELARASEEVLALAGGGLATREQIFTEGGKHKGIALILNLLERE